VPYSASIPSPLPPSPLPTYSLLPPLLSIYHSLCHYIIYPASATATPSIRQPQLCQLHCHCFCVCHCHCFCDCNCHCLCIPYTHVSYFLCFCFPTATDVPPIRQPQLHQPHCHCLCVRHCHCLLISPTRVSYFLCFCLPTATCICITSWLSMPLPPHFQILLVLPLLASHCHSLLHSCISLTSWLSMPLPPHFQILLVLSFFCFCFSFRSGSLPLTLPLTSVSNQATTATPSSCQTL